jgi:tetratricopeptide (TPR) repeat protein
MKTRCIWGMATVLAAVITVAAQSPAPAPVAPEAPVVPQAAPMAPVAPRIAIPAPAPFAMPAIAPLAPLPPIDLDLDLGVNLDLNLDLDGLSARVAESSRELTDRLSRLAVDQVEIAAIAPMAAIAAQDMDPGRAAEIARRAQESAQRAQERAQENAQRAQERAQDRGAFQRGNEEALYHRGTSMLDSGEWARAVEAFDGVIQKAGPHADGATYWKAWALYKEGQKDPSLATLTGLETNFPKSRWLNDAKALEVEVKQSSGQPVKPGEVSDEEMKILALNGLMHSDPDAALPVLEKLLKSSASPKLKEHVLIVLSTHGTNAKSRELLAQVARGGSNPDLQIKAIAYLGRTGSDSRPILAEIYNSSDETVKHRILQSYMESSDKEHLVQVAKTDSNADLRQEAVRYLANMNARDEIWQLYTAESSADVKKQIIGSLYSDGFSPKVADIARTEKDPALRRIAIRTLSRFGRSGDLLAGLYDGEKDDQNKKEIINGLFIRQDAKALVDIARKESNPELKREIVQRLSTMKSKEATDYMVELLSK